MVVFENDYFRVRTGWLYSFRVEDKMRGTTVEPTLIQKERIGIAWHNIRAGKYKKACPPGRYGEDLLFRIFGMAVLDPRSDLAQRFEQENMDAFCTAIVREANIQYLTDKL